MTGLHQHILTTRQEEADQIQADGAEQVLHCTYDHQHNIQVIIVPFCHCHQITLAEAAHRPPSQEPLSSPQYHVHCHYFLCLFGKAEMQHEGPSYHSQSYACIGYHSTQPLTPDNKCLKSKGASNAHNIVEDGNGGCFLREAEHCEVVREPQKNVIIQNRGHPVVRH